MATTNVPTERQRRKRGSQQLYLRRDGTYAGRATVEVDGERVRKLVPLGTKDRAAARAKLAKLQSGETTAADASKPDTVSTFADAWLSEQSGRMAKDERQRLEAYWLPALGHLPLPAVRPPHVRSLLVELANGERRGAAGKPLSATSVRHARATLRRLFDAAWRAELVPENPVAKVRLPRMATEQKVRAILTDDEIRSLLACGKADPEIKVAVLLSRTIGGMRAGDLRALDWAHFGEGFATCSVPRRKTRSKRPPQLLDVPEQVRPLLAAWHVAHGSPKGGPVFPVRRGPRAGERKADGSNWAAALRRDLLLAGVDRHELHHETDDTLPVDFHSTRRAYCTALAKANVATSVAQVLAGHSSAAVHQRYVQAASIRALPEAAGLALPALESKHADPVAIPLPIAPLSNCGHADQIGNAAAYLPAPSETPSENPLKSSAQGQNRTDDTRIFRARPSSLASATSWNSAAVADPDNASGPQIGNDCLSPLPISRAESTATSLLAVPAKPLEALARQVLKSVDGRSRLARRHAAELARRVLEHGATLPPGQPERPSFVVTMARLCDAVVSLPEAAARLPELLAAVG